ncbi:MAG: hypothetical protein LH629_02525, partial [Ignavibacteria bacterium]|nr:hypothetical protein [Ignavibacteria bacterium]
MFPEEQFNRNAEQSQRKKVSGISIFLIFCTVAFLGAGIYLYADNTKKIKENTDLNSSLIESESRYATLDSKYTASLVDIQSLKGKNEALDKLVAEKEKAILALKATLNKERKSRKISEAD